ncbi:SAM-dependent methyltransferase [Polyangium sp. 15x6]|uniref:SAM-dependent methyltransferase n=1 Tax=Polyangium sp. 15x6 TaxID=3042687 RepID=UPI0032B5A08E
MTMKKHPPAAQTAFGPMVIAAVEQHYPEAQRLIRDDLAVRFLPPGLRLGVHACKWTFMRNLGITATEKKAPGIWGGVLCRKRYADDKVVEAIDAGITQVVILGAGLDTRAYRLLAPAGVSAFEVDLPANITYKQERLHEIYGRVPEHVTLIPVDFQIDDLGSALAGNGFRLEARAMFVWEAVTQYLTEEGFRKTLGFLSKAAAGSRLIFTYIREDFLAGINFYGAERIHQDMKKHDVWHFGIAPENVDGLLRAYGWAEHEQVGSSEYFARYIEPSGRALSVSEIERFVYAEKR